MTVNGGFWGTLEAIDARLGSPEELRAHQNSRNNSISSMASHVGAGDRCTLDESLNKAYLRRASMRCYAPNSVAGLKTVSFNQAKSNWRDGWGASKLTNSSLRVHPSTGEVYTTTLFPTVAATSTQTAGSLGGAEVCCLIVFLCCN